MKKDASKKNPWLYEKVERKALKKKTERRSKVSREQIQVIVMNY